MILQALFAVLHSIEHKHQSPTLFALAKISDSLCGGNETSALKKLIVMEVSNDFKQVLILRLLMSLTYLDISRMNCYVACRSVF
jgi:hypothetical protein